MKKYLVQELIGEETIVSLMTEPEIVELLKLDNESGYLTGLCIYDVSTIGIIKKLIPGDFWSADGTIASISDADYYNAVQDC